MASIDGETVLLAIGSVLLTISSLSISACFVLFVRNWNSPLFKARGRIFSLLLFAGVSSLILIMACAPLVYKLPSFAIEYKLLTSQVYAFGSVPYFLKGFILLIKFEVCFHLSKNISSSEEPSKAPPNWYVCNQWIIRSGYPLFGLWILGVSIMILPAVLIEDIQVLSSYQQVIGGIWFLAYLWLFKNLRGRYDEWGIKRELKFSVLATLAMALVYVVFVFLEKKGAFEQMFATILLWFLILFFLINSFLLPVLRDKKADDLRKSRRGADLETEKGLRQFLKNEENFKLFQKHMENELSLENLVFCRSIETYDTLVDKYRMNKDKELAKEVIKMASQIFLDFIPEDASTPVNISHIHRKHLQETSKALFEFLIFEGQKVERKPTLTDRIRGQSQCSTSFQVKEVEEVPESILHMFEESEDAVMNLMEKDSFIRFKRSPAFKEMQEELKTHQIIEDVVLEAKSSVQV
jgi:hypothetical protein